MTHRQVYHCSLCSYSTTSLANLTCHNRSHSMSQPFSCPHCDQTYASLSGLRCHILRSGFHPGKCLYHCTWCRGFATNVRTVMKRHLYEQHPAIMPRNQPCVDVNEVLGIYHPEEDPALLPPQASVPGAARKPPTRHASRGERLGVWIAPRESARPRCLAAREAGVKLAARGRGEAPKAAEKAQGRVRDQLVQTGIGLWTRAQFAKFC